ncbi:MAG: N-acetyltransferase [Candidatus Cloacimonadales bacterium]|nr:N-acetyltransferase [Candidatus Cloacimonadales bacterium]
MSQHIAESAEIGRNSSWGFNCIIMGKVEIGQDCQIGHNVIIYEGSIIGNGVRIDDNTIVGKKPLSSPRSIFKVDPNLKPAEIGDLCQIGANVVIYVQSKIGNSCLIADSATIRENVEIGDLNIIGRNVTIENFTIIGNRNKIETNAYITAYSEIGDYCFVAPAVATSNDNYMARDKERYKHFKGVTIKDGGRIGVNATILPGKTIHEDGMVAGGSVVSQDVESEEIWLGNPAKPVGKVSEAQLLKNNLDKK